MNWFYSTFLFKITLGDCSFDYTLQECLCLLVLIHQVVRLPLYIPPTIGVISFVPYWRKLWPLCFTVISSVQSTTQLLSRYNVCSPGSPHKFLRGFAIIRIKFKLVTKIIYIFFIFFKKLLCGWERGIPKQRPPLKNGESWTPSPKNA